MEPLQKDQHNEELKTLSRESIYQALFLLMKQHDYKKISITDIVQKAGVSRMAYYRNFKSKEDIIRYFLDGQFRRYLDELKHTTGVTFFQLYESFFASFRVNKELISLMDRANLSYILLEKFTEYLHDILRDFFPSVKDTTTEYELTYAAGGLYNLLMQWARGGMSESDTEMAEIAIKIGWPKITLADVDPHSPVF